MQASGVKGQSISLAHRGSPFCHRGQSCSQAVWRALPLSLRSLSVTTLPQQLQPGAPLTEKGTLALVRRLPILTTQALPVLRDTTWVEMPH